MPVRMKKKRVGNAREYCMKYTNRLQQARIDMQNARTTKEWNKANSRVRRAERKLIPCINSYTHSGGSKRVMGPIAPNPKAVIHKL